MHCLNEENLKHFLLKGANYSAPFCYWYVIKSHYDSVFYDINSTIKGDALCLSKYGWC